jgi:hypothetical protein
MLPSESSAMAEALSRICPPKNVANWSTGSMINGADVS